MTRWFTSDLHFQHKNICKYTDRSKYTTPEKHAEWLTDLWNKQVSASDEIYHLGDFSFAKKYEEIAETVSKLNGQKHFLKGNHDDRKILERLKTDGLICNWHDYKEIKIGETPTCLFHFCIRAWHRQHYGSFHLFGHSHGSLKDAQGLCLDVGLDSAYNIYSEHRFFSEQDVLQYMQGREIYISDHHKDRTTD